MVRMKVTAPNIGLLLGPVLAALIGFGPRLGFPVIYDKTQPDLHIMAGIATLMAIWRSTEAIPLAATALLPLGLFPLTGIMSAGEVSGEYTSDTIFLFLGGFLIALALEDSEFPRRVALHIVARFSRRPAGMVLGFMVATGLMSMWISNTVSALIMLPIAASVLAKAPPPDPGIPHSRNLSAALMLGIAYSASIGGTATLIGTPPNAFLAAHMERRGQPLGFVEWMIIGVPFSLALGLAVWGLLVYVLFPLGRQSFGLDQSVIQDQVKQMGSVRQPEIRALCVWASTVLLWITMEPVSGWGWVPLLGFTNAVGKRVVGLGTIAILMAIICFAIPSGKGKERLLTWDATARLPWGILLLFGGGLALSSGMGVTGLGRYLGGCLASSFGALGASATGSLVVALGTTTMTEFMSNTATTEMLLPIIDQVRQQLGIYSIGLLVAATLAASCAFMLPVATPPNAVAYSSGAIRIKDMLWAGLWMNILAAVVIVLLLSLISL